MPPLRSRTVTHGRNMAGARALLRATGVAREDIGKPIVAVANSFTEFVPGHVHLREVGQVVADAVRTAGAVPREFNTIAVDDGIAMGHGGMLYSLPSRELIADSVEYMVNAHCADALVCVSNCDKITPGMLMAALRLNIPTVFVSGGPMKAGRVQPGDVTSPATRKLDLIDPMIASADPNVSDDQLAVMEENACPTCGSCSGMFTANSMNCLTEAIGLALPGNGTTLATHVARRALFERAGALTVELARRYYEDGDESVLPRSIATRDAFENAMALDVAMGGSTNTILHLLAAAHEARVGFGLKEIDELSRRVPCLCKVAPSSDRYHVEDVHRAGGIPAILAELDRGGLLNPQVHTVHSGSLREFLDTWDLRSPTASDDVAELFHAAPGGVRTTRPFSQASRWSSLDLDRRPAASGTCRTRTPGTAGWPCCTATWPRRAPSSRRPASPRSCGGSPGRRRCSKARRPPSRASWAAGSSRVTWWSSGTRGRAAGRACRRCFTRPASSRARAWAGPARWSPTAGSPAARPGCPSAMRRRRPRRAGRSRWPRTATTSTSTSRPGRWSWWCRTPNWPRAGSRSWPRWAGTGPRTGSRPVSEALRVYAALATSASTGAVRDIGRLGGATAGGTAAGGAAAGGTAAGGTAAGSAAGGTAAGGTAASGPGR